MFSYTVRTKVLSDPKSSLLAFSDLIIDDKLVVTGFKVMRGAQGDLWVSAPSQKTNKIDEKTGKDSYIDTTRFLDPKASEDDRQTPLQKEIYQEMIADFERSTKSTRAGSSVSSTPTTTASGSKTQKNPLW